MKLKKLFFVMLIAVICVGCGSEKAKEEAKQQKALEDAQEEELYMEIGSPGLSLGEYGSDYDYDKNFKGIRKLIVEDYKKLNAEQTAIEDMYDAFYQEMGTNSEFLKEAPEFANLKQKATAIIERIQQVKAEANAYIEEKALKKRANETKLDNKYKKIYVEIMSDEGALKARVDSMNSKLDLLNEYVTVSLSAFDYLTAHQADWDNINGELTFYNEQVYQEYSSIVDALQE